MQYNIIMKVHFCRLSVSIWPVTCAGGRLGTGLLRTYSDSSLMDETNQTTCRKLKDDMQMVFLLMDRLEGHVMLIEGLAAVHIFIVVFHRASAH